MAKKKRKIVLVRKGVDMDMTPMIDIVFLLIHVKRPQPAREQPRVCSGRVASFPGPGLCLARVDGGTAGTEGSEPKPRNSYSQDLITFLDPSKNGGHHRTATLRLEVRPGCRCELRTVRTSPPRRARATHRRRAPRGLEPAGRLRREVPQPVRPLRPAAARPTASRGPRSPCGGRLLPDGRDLSPSR